MKAQITIIQRGERFEFEASVLYKEKPIEEDVGDYDYIAERAVRQLATDTGNIKSGKLDAFDFREGFTVSVYRHLDGLRRPRGFHASYCFPNGAEVNAQVLYGSVPGAGSVKLIIEETIVLQSPIVRQRL